jgi:hypothetical protein
MSNENLGIITSIKEVFEIQMGGNSYYDKCDGYEIKTDKVVLQILINNHQRCCEDWGYLSTPDDTSHFIGAELYRWKNTATELAEEKLREETNYDSDSNALRFCRAQFITLFTSKGEITFTVYNEHNGFYSHGAFIVENGDIWDYEYL